MFEFANCDHDRAVVHTKVVGKIHLVEVDKYGEATGKYADGLSAPDDIQEKAEKFAPKSSRCPVCGADVEWTD